MAALRACRPQARLQNGPRTPGHRLHQLRGAAAAASRAGREGLEAVLPPPPSRQAADTRSGAQSPQEAAVAPAAAAAPPIVAAAAAAAAAGIVVALDVFAPSSLHLLAPLDAAAHAWVSELHLDPQLQRLVAGKLVSDVGIVTGLAGWAAVAVAALRAPHPPLLRGLATCGALYLLAGGSIRHGDTPLVDALKKGFQRARPSDIHSTYAFPSGHTTAATFICGALLFVLLPLALEAAATEQRRRQQQQQQGQQQPGQQPGESQPGLFAAAGAVLLQHRWPLWVGAAAVTGVGRVLADAHWCSDVLAGALLGAALTAAAVQLSAGGRAQSSQLLLGLMEAPRRRR